MLRLILAVVIFLVALVVAIVAFTQKEKNVGTIVLVVGLLVAVGLGVWSTVRTVPTGHTGVVTSFGRVEDYTLDSGVHFTAPWKKVHNMDNRIQKQTVNLSCFSSDIQEVSMTYTINYQISKSNAMTIYSTIGEKYFDTVILPNIAESVKIVTAKYTAEQLVGFRTELANVIEENLSNSLTTYNIVVVSTSVEDIDFTDAFTNAVEAKQVAQQDKLRAQTQAEQKIIEAEAQAEVRKVEADASAYEVLARAEAEAEANRKIAESLTAELIDYTYANTWNGSLPEVVTGDGSIPILNIGDE